jgi:hypothetical protein
MYPGFTVHIVTTLPLAKLENRIFRIQGSSISMTELAEILGTTVEKVDKMPNDEAFGGFLTWIATEWAAGKATTGWDIAAGKQLYAPDQDNALWTGHKWKSVQEVLKK